MTCWLVAVLSVAVCAAAAPASRGQSLTVREMRGGATLVVSREPGNTDVVLEAFFRVGIEDENRSGESGMSALMARAWTGDGVNRTREMLARDVARFGSLGVWSTPDYVELWTVSGLADHTVAAQTLLQNVVSTPLFPPATIAGARRDIARERALRADGLLSDVTNHLRGRVFVSPPAGRDALGDAVNVSAITSTGLRRFYAKTIGGDASRAVFVVAGDIAPDDAERLIRSALLAGDWAAWHDAPTHVRPVPVDPGSAESIPEGLRPLDIHRAAPTRIALVGYIAPGTSEGAKTAGVLQVLDAVLAGGKDCRLFALRDRPATDMLPIGYDVRAFLEAGRSRSLYLISVIGTAQPARATQDRVVAELRVLASGERPVTADEMTRAVAFLQGKHRKERQRLYDRAAALGYAQVMGLGAGFEAEYDARIAEVSVADVNALARRIFSANAAYVATGTDP